MCLPGVRAVLPGHDVPARGESHMAYQAMMCLPGARAVLPGHDVPARGESRTTRP